MKLKTLILPIFVTLTFQLCGQNNVVLSGNSSGKFIQNLINNTTNMDGQLDQAFGRGTVLGTNYIGSEKLFFQIGNNPVPFPSSLALQSDGKMVVAMTYKSGEANTFALARFTADGKPDLTFGRTTTTTTSPTTGFVYINQSISGTALNTGDIYDVTSCIAIQSDGKIVVGGYTLYFPGTYIARYSAFARFNPDGTLDASFGETTDYTESIIPGTFFINQSISGTAFDTGYLYDQMNTLAIQADGTIVAGGFSYYRSDVYLSYCALVKLTSDGLLDQTFGVSNGAVQSNFPGTEYLAASISGTAASSGAIADEIVALTFQSDGSIIAGGYSFYHILGEFIDNTYFALMKVLPDGNFDSEFGVIGEYTNSIIPGTVYINGSISSGTNKNNVIMSIALQSNGNIVAGGFTGTGSGYKQIDNSLVALARFTPQGGLDTTFGMQGMYTQSTIPGTIFITESITGRTERQRILDVMTTVVLQNDGSLVVAGYSAFTGMITPVYSYSALARFTPQGSLDGNFGATGDFTESIIPGTVFINTSISDNTNKVLDQMYGLALGADGSLMTAGITIKTNNNVSCSVAKFFNPPSFASYQKSYTGVGAGLNS